jgi:hypothetical protein
MRALHALVLITWLPAIAAAQTLQTGVNQAWLGDAYGHDLTDAFDASGWERVFARAAAHEARVVRVWIFEDMEGVRFDAEGLPAGVEPRLLTHLTHLSALARTAGVRVYWTHAPSASTPWPRCSRSWPATPTSPGAWT